jgi:predicted transcriptional regulator
VLNVSKSVSKLDGEGEMTCTFLISVRPTWADAFFLDCNPKTIELRKGNFGTSLKAGDSIVIYSTLLVGEAIGTVKVIKRESLAVDRLWQESQQGQLAKVSREQFKTSGGDNEVIMLAL